MQDQTMQGEQKVQDTEDNIYDARLLKSFVSPRIKIFRRPKIFLTDHQARTTGQMRTD